MTLATTVGKWRGSVASARPARRAGSCARPPPGESVSLSTGWCGGLQGRSGGAFDHRRGDADVTSVLLVSPAIPRQELNVIARAVRAHVQHVVKIMSKASADSPIARRRGQFEIEQGLIASGLGYTLLKNKAYRRRDHREINTGRQSLGT